VGHKLWGRSTRRGEPTSSGQLASAAAAGMKINTSAAPRLPSADLDTSWS
jgi:hypothetical protein